MLNIYITVHLGGGAGKAIVGMASEKDAVIVLEKPEKYYWVDKARKKNISVCIEPRMETVEKLIESAQTVIINWWGHPLMIRFMAEFPKEPCKLMLWSHVNGCVYPYLPFDFVNSFDRVLFTTPYSYQNLLWTEDERKEIERKSRVVYGMGEFCPEQYPVKSNYLIKEYFRVGYVGTLNYAKLAPDFVQYCEAVAKKIDNIRFVLVGDLDSRVEEDIRKSDISDKFELIGYTSNVEEQYLSFDVLGYLLNGYNYATTENVLLEAMAYGLPIVALNQAVERHIIEPGENGFLAEAGEYEGYAEILEHLYQSEEARSTLGHKAHEACVKKYSIKKNQRELQNILDSLQNTEKRIHICSVINGHSPYEWFLYFMQKDYHKKSIESVYYQDSKGSIKQYIQYFPEDKDLELIKKKIEGEVDNESKI